MTSKRKSLKNLRKFAYIRQSGLCFYCGQPMWLDSLEAFAARYGLTKKQARLLQCTGEHLHPHSDGGDASEANIAAACLYCNQHRHQAKRVRPPQTLKKYVRHRIANGKWHPVLLTGSNLQRSAQ